MFLNVFFIFLDFQLKKLVQKSASAKQEERGKEGNTFFFFFGKRGGNREAFIPIDL